MSRTYTCFECGYSILPANQMKWIRRVFNEQRRGMMSFGPRVWIHVCADDGDCIRRGGIMGGDGHVEALAFQDLRVGIFFDTPAGPPEEPRYILTATGLFDRHEEVPA